MYVNSGYLFHSRIPFKERKQALRILSAGVYQLFDWPRLPTWRPRGRVDWQLIYIAAGKGYFTLDQKETVVPAGNMILYQPGQEQRYYFLGEDHSQYWFVHFTGRQVKNILRHYQIPLDSHILPTGISYEYEDLFRKMRDELLECSWGYEEVLALLLRELFVTINRRMNKAIPGITGFVQDEIAYAGNYFREHYAEEINIRQYAASRNMSSSWFHHVFQKATGTSPGKYIQSLRIRNAQALLETTDGTVSEISRIVGYENPLYFSRLFKKAKGVSPMQYRKVYREGSLKSDNL